MLAERLPPLLPQLDDETALEVTALHSIAGALPPGAPLIRRPPFQSPHHTTSVAALVGGGSGIARPGALSLAHRGVLFLDECPEFGARALDALRQPLEDGQVVISRTRGSMVYPARVQLILAANPCPCAKPAGDRECECSPATRRRYLGRLSGPLLDRIDVQVQLPPLSAAELLSTGPRSEASAVVAARVSVARMAAAERWATAKDWPTNAEVPGPALRSAPWRLPAQDTAGLREQMDRGVLSARGFDRVLRIAWTIADLDGRLRPNREDLNEATLLRTGVAA